VPRRKQSQKNRQAEPVSRSLSQDAVRPLCVLVVDQDQDTVPVFEKIAAARSMNLVRATSAAQARLLLAETPVDLALIDPHLPDASGMDLIHEIKRSKAATQMILMTDAVSVQDTIEAVRAGVADVVCKPLATDDLTQRIDAAAVRQEQDKQRRQRIARLRRVCRKLNQAREEVTQQVDILCNDLVSAYQELASQVQGVVQVNEFTAMVKHELDLEQILRKTLEYLLQKAGPTNAAVFLPAAGDEYALGGYVNYDCTKESADLLLQHMADVLAPKIGELIQPLHITDNNTLQHWLGADSAYLADSHMISFACRHNDEPLAVITMFRDGGQPFDDSVMEICNAVGPLLGSYLAKIIRIHHRHVSGYNN
jgi:DNA-binding response OmpR family regulator